MHPRHLPSPFTGLDADKDVTVRAADLWLAQYVERVAADPGARPGLRAHEKSVRLTAPEIVCGLRELLGAKLVAYVGSACDTATVRQWAAGEAAPPVDTLKRLRITYAIVGLLVERDSAAVAQAWLLGANPRLNDVSPVRLLREGDLDDVYPRVLSAAHAAAA